MFYINQNSVLEWSYESAKSYNDCFNEVSVNVEITDPDGIKSIIPAFWHGEETWSVRYSSPKPGIHNFRTICSDTENTGLHNRMGSIEVLECQSDNPLYKHGPLKISDNGKYMTHLDGTPFLWLGDTWWMGFTKRLRWPDEFKFLTNDRVKKGFNVVQIVAGLYPDMEPFDDRGANEAGFPWDKSFKSINPSYFDMVDLRINWLVKSGIVPCIVGSWGYYLEFAGTNAIKKHWNYLIARYGAYPVVWCIAGEALMPFYGSVYWPEEKNKKYREIHSDVKKKDEYMAWARKGWTDVTRHVRATDPFKRLVTIHPTDYGHEMVEDISLIDFDMLQTGHEGWGSMKTTVDMVQESLKIEPSMPVIDSEVSYEGIGGMCGPEVQRFVFLASMLSGAAGHTYGANGIWQINSVQKPYGPSPHGMTWGNTSWEEAMDLPGSKHIGYAKKLLERYRWWLFEPHPEWIEPHADRSNTVSAYAAGIPGEVRIFYLPLSFVFGKKPVLRNLEKDLTYKAFFYDSTSGYEYELGEVKAKEDGTWTLPERFFPTYMDLVLVLEKK
jgi:hypothetical protein